MRMTLLAAALFALMVAGPGLSAAPVEPFEAGSPATAANGIDLAVRAALQKHGLQPANPCSDEVFLRRVYLDVIGTLPEPRETMAFLDDTRPGKRALLIDALLARPEFADYWALRWCDVLRVKAEFPINLWPNATQAYHHWIREAIRTNMPYDQFVRAMLTSTGSNFRVPPVNFMRAVQGREPAALAAATALTFMGTRLDTWPEAKRAGMTAFFSRVAFKSTLEWKEEIVCLDPAATEPVKAMLPDGTPVTIPAGQDPRVVFADWLLKPGNPWFAKNVANRLWAWLLGRGIINEVDDIRPDNPPSNPELLAYLEKELVTAKYDLRHLYRLILNSQTYQQSSIPQGNKPEAEALFACYPVRRLDAEVLVDALTWIGGPPEQYESAVPEPYTFVPGYERTIKLADGSITSPFLEMFGRPPRDTGLVAERITEPNEAQALHLLNSSHVRAKIEQSPRLQAIARAAGGDPPRVIRGVYLTVLSRLPTPAELAAVEQYAKTPGLTPKQALDDLAWALVNSKEFLYRH